MPYQEGFYNHVISEPRLSNITHIGMPQINFDDGQMEYEMKQIQGTRNIVQNTYTQKVETVGVNSQTQNYKHMK